MKKCTICKIEKSLDNFNKRKRSKDGRQNVCRSCNSERAKKYYKQHTASHRRAVYARQKRKRREVNEFFWSIKTAYGCKLCKENDPCCLEFHHLRDKKFGLANTIRDGWSMENVLEEIKKCVILCANCHRKVHWRKKMSDPYTFDGPINEPLEFINLLIEEGREIEEKRNLAEVKPDHVVNSVEEAREGAKASNPHNK